MRLTPRKAQLLSMASMVLIMTCVIVFISTAINFGIDTSFAARFFRSWAVAFLLAFPLVVILMPRLQKFFQSFIQ